MAEILREEGYHVGEFSSLDAALTELRAGARPCLVLMDLLMPGMGGQEFLDALRSDVSLATIPVVMVTGARTKPAGIEVLHKPFDLTDLIDTVAKHCEHASAPGPRSSADPDRDDHDAGRRPP
jgi:CheY-like chemotaxis protein